MMTVEEVLELIEIKKKELLLLLRATRIELGDDDDTL